MKLASVQSQGGEPVVAMVDEHSLMEVNELLQRGAGVGLAATDMIDLIDGPLC